MATRSFFAASLVVLGLALSGCLGAGPTQTRADLQAVPKAVYTFVESFFSGSVSSIVPFVADTVEWKVTVVPEEATQLTTTTRTLTREQFDERYRQIKSETPAGIDVHYSYEHAAYDGLAQASGVVRLSHQSGNQSFPLLLEFMWSGDAWLVTSVEFAVPEPADDVVVEPDHFEILPHNVVDAEYSEALDRLIMISSDPPRLYIYDSVLQSSTPVELPAAPRAVSVSPSGDYAAVGHDRLLTLVNLISATREKVLDLSFEVGDLVLAGNGYVYAFATSRRPIYSIDLATGEEMPNEFLYDNVKAALHPDGDAIYTTAGKFDISNGAAQHVREWSAYGWYRVEWDVWISRDGLRLFTGRGLVLRATSDWDRMFEYVGSLSHSGGFIRHLSHSSVNNLVAAIPQYDPEYVDFYDYTYLNYEGKIRLPGFDTPTSTVDGEGQFIFFGADETSLIVVLKARTGSGILHDTGIVRYDLGSGASGEVGLAAVTPGSSKLLRDYLYRLATGGENAVLQEERSQ